VRTPGRLTSRPRVIIFAMHHLNEAVHKKKIFSGLLVAASKIQG
jgi:hypothetical protein